MKRLNKNSISLYRNLKDNEKCAGVQFYENVFLTTIILIESFI